MVCLDVLKPTSACSNLQMFTLFLPIRGPKDGDNLTSLGQTRRESAVCTLLATVV